MNSKQNTSGFERELKLDLDTASNHARLEKRLRRLPFLGVKEQLNVFFDTKDARLRSQKLALRLRQEVEKFLLTAKGGKLQTGDLAVRPEIECEISVAEGLSLLQKTKSIADLSNPPLTWIEKQTKHSRKDLSLQEILRFTNQRQCFLLEQDDLSLVLELDRTDYGNGIQAFELEVEFQNLGEYLSAKAILQNIFNEENLPWKISAQSKYARALQIQRY